MIRIRTVRSMAEYFQIERLQAQVWGFEPSRDSGYFVIPAHALKITQLAGGIILGAWDDPNDLDTDPERMVGFVQGYAGFRDGRRLHVSNMLGVLPEYRDQGIGYRFKLAQRQTALQQGVDWMVWTYDPLQSRNAHLNHKLLGAICSRYYPNYYGVLESAVHSGLPTDRFEVDWHIASTWVTEHLRRQRISIPIDVLQQNGAHLAIETQPCGNFISPSQVSIGQPWSDLVLVEIPPDIGAIMQVDMGLALAWRQTTRLAFTTLFGSGYTVVDFLSEMTASGQRRSAYVLQRSFVTAN